MFAIFIISILNDVFSNKFWLHRFVFIYNFKARFLLNLFLNKLATSIGFFQKIQNGQNQIRRNRFWHRNSYTTIIVQEIKKREKSLEDDVDVARYRLLTDQLRPLAETNPLFWILLKN